MRVFVVIGENSVYCIFPLVKFPPDNSPLGLVSAVIHTVLQVKVSFRLYIIGILTGNLLPLYYPNVTSLIDCPVHITYTNYYANLYIYFTLDIT